MSKDIKIKVGDIKAKYKDGKWHSENIGTQTTLRGFQTDRAWFEDNGDIDYEPNILVPYAEFIAEVMGDAEIIFVRVSEKVKPDRVY